MLANSDYTEHRHRQSELQACFTRIAQEDGEGVDMDRRIVEQIWTQFPHLFHNSLWIIVTLTVSTIGRPTVTTEGIVYRLLIRLNYYCYYHNHQCAVCTTDLPTYPEDLSRKIFQGNWEGCPTGVMPILSSQITVFRQQMTDLYYYLLW